MTKAITRSIERDNYILAQALYVAIKTMEAVEPAYLREVSNIADMKLIFETAFPHYQMIFQAADAERAAFQAKLAESDTQDGDRD